MRALYGFGFSQEDDRTERAALGLPGGRVLSITSAGDMALSLLAAGADRVVGVDIEPNQARLARLKLAAVVHLPRAAAIAFLGFLPASESDRRAWFGSVLEGLAEVDRAFWRDHADTALRGVVREGRFERFLRRPRGLLRRWFEPRLRRLFACASLGEQREVFDRWIDRPVVRSAFRIAFHPRVYARRGIDPRGLRALDARESLGDRFFERFRAMCVNTPAAVNPFLQMNALGRVLDEDCVPSYLSDEGGAALRARHHAVSFAIADVTSLLEQRPAGSFDRFHLSNVPDWLDGAAFDALLHTIAERAARPARLVWRFIHADRDPPTELRAVIRPDRVWGAELVAADRFPIYTVVPAEVGGPGGAA